MQTQSRVCGPKGLGLEFSHPEWEELQDLRREENTLPPCHSCAQLQHLI